MAREWLVAVYESPVVAQEAMRRLREAGVPDHAIETHRDADHAPQAGAVGSETRLSAGQTFWAWLLGEESYQDHRTVYQRAIGGGGSVVSAVVEKDAAARIAAVMEGVEPVEMARHDTKYTTPSPGGEPARTDAVATTHGVEGETETGRVRRYPDIPEAAANI